VGNDSSLDRGARDQRRTDLQFAPLPTASTWSIVISAPTSAGNLFYFEFFASSNFVLLAAGFYDRVHVFPFAPWRITLGSSSDYRARRAVDSLFTPGQPAAHHAKSLRVYPGNGEHASDPAETHTGGPKRFWRFYNSVILA
jgi:hypothetical protein